MFNFMSMKEMLDFINKIAVMANNPECKSYEEALENESNSYDCLFIDETGYIYNYGQKHFADLDCESSGLKVQTILGLPLTLERLLVALEHKIVRLNEEEALLFFRKNNGVRTVYKNKINYVLGGYSQSAISHPYSVLRLVTIKGITLQIIDIWQKNKTLQNQSEETIATIYNILV